MEIVMRESTRDDLPAILRLYGQLGQDDGSVLSLEDAEKIYAQIGSYPDYRIYLAILDGRAVGTFALLIMDNLAHLGAKSAILEEVVVEEGLRGMGVGKKMMDFANDLCRRKECYKMAFSSNRNREAAHRFYESLGFIQHGFSYYITCDS